MENKFHKYQHIERLGNEEVEGILKGKVYVFPKLDGTNGSVWVKDLEIDRVIIGAGSRNRELSLESDNFNFFANISKNERILAFLEKYPYMRLYGEYLVPHTIKTYRDNAWNKFYIFDVSIGKDENRKYLPYDEYAPLLKQFALDFIPPLAILEQPDEKDLFPLLENNFYLMKEGEIGEGIVIKNYEFINKWGHQIWAKIVRAEFKELNFREFGHPAQKIPLERKIVEKFCTETLIEKTFSKIAAENGWHSDLIPRLLGTVFHDFVTEEIWAIIRKNKYPTIDFRKLYKFTIEKIKLTKKELFP